MSHRDGRAGWWKSPSPDLERAPGAIWRPELLDSGMDYEVSVRGAGRGCRAAGEGALTRDRAESGDDDLRRGDQSGSRAFADLDTRGYWVASSGSVTDEVWKKYIEDQKPEEPDDDFKVI